MRLLSGELQGFFIKAHLHSLFRKMCIRLLLGVGAVVAAARLLVKVEAAVVLLLWGL